MFKSKSIVPIVLFAVLFLSSIPVVSQQQSDDSLLLQKVSNIDVSLSSLDESDEDLYDSPVSFQTFYDDLQDDGEWIMITKEEIEKELNDGEGQSFSSLFAEDVNLIYIWKPSVTEAEWRPYVNGRWVYTTSGWMWVSNYRWGWACYHYGRWWKSANYGWVWLPGYVWAPAWVEWRIAENHVGWCPLTPRAEWKWANGISTSNYGYRNPDNQWVFVGKEKFTNNLDNSVVIPVNENNSFVKNSESVLEMKFDNGRVRGRGPDVGDIEKRTGKMIRERDIKHGKDKGISLVGDNDVSVFREKFKKHIKKSDDGKYIKFDKPKKFKKTPKAKKIYKKIKIIRKRHIHRIQ